MKKVWKQVLEKEPESASEKLEERRKSEKGEETFGEPEEMKSSSGKKEMKKNVENLRR